MRPHVSILGGPLSKVHSAFEKGPILIETWFFLIQIEAVSTQHDDFTTMSAFGTAKRQQRRLPRASS